MGGPGEGVFLQSKGIRDKEPSGPEGLPSGLFSMVFTVTEISMFYQEQGILPQRSGRNCHFLFGTVTEILYLFWSDHLRNTFMYQL